MTKMSMSACSLPKKPEPDLYHAFFRRTMAREPVLNVTTLRRLKALSWATDQQLEQLISHMSLRRVERRPVLFTERALSDGLYFLVVGGVQLSLRGLWGEAVSVRLVYPGEA